MDALLQSMGQSVAEDVRHLTHFAPPALIELEPQGSGWHLPLGFVSLSAAGLLLLAVGGVQTRMQQQLQQHRHGVRKQRTHLHRRRQHPVAGTALRH